jgi:hypothetical protein
MKSKLLFFFLFIFISCCGLVSCHDDDNDGVSEETTTDAYSPVSLSDSVQINASVLIYSDVTDVLSTPIKLRIHTSANSISNAQVVFITSSSLDANKDALKALIDNRGIVVVADPDETSLKQFIENLDLQITSPSNINDLDVFAISGNETFSQEYVYSHKSDTDVSGQLNSLVSWINTQLAENNFSYDISDAVQPDITSFEGSQVFTLTFPYKLEKEIDKLASSNPDNLTGTGQVIVSYTVRPLFAFEGQSGSGDYYIINASINPSSTNMFHQPYSSKHGGYSTYICGYYLTSFSYETSIVDNNGSETNVGLFPTLSGSENPTPNTTVGATSYSESMTNSFNWSVTAKGSVKAAIGVTDSTGHKPKASAGVGAEAEVSATIGGGVSYTKSQTRSVSDLDIALSYAANSGYHYGFQFNNLPRTKTDKQNIPAPPIVAQNGQDLYQSCIIYVPRTKNNDVTHFWLKTTITSLNFQCAYYTTNFSLKFHDYTMSDLTEAPTWTKWTQLEAPPRTPTGIIYLTNNFAKGEITKVLFSQYDSSGKLIKTFTVDNKTLQPGGVFYNILPLGKYGVEFTVEADRVETKYKLPSDKYVDVTLGSENELTTSTRFQKM